MSEVPFRKMHGLGNDFILIDGRKTDILLETLDIARLCDRRIGIGCDQFGWLETSSKADIFLRILNADGSEVAACGNITRCVAWLIMQEKQQLHCRIETLAGVLPCWTESLAVSASIPPSISVAMGAPRLHWQQIPLHAEMDTLHLPLKGDPVAVSMGNPHLVFFVSDVQQFLLEAEGAAWEHHPFFPERTNVEVVEVTRPDFLTLRVWERGVGMTRACGTGACAALVAAVRRGLAEEKATVQMAGGTLTIHWQHRNTPDETVIMTGEVHTSFQGVFELEAFALRRT
jgi:diaminopimelate epimerase